MPSSSSAAVDNFSKRTCIKADRTAYPKFLSESGEEGKNFFLVGVRVLRLGGGEESCVN